MIPCPCELYLGYWISQKHKNQLILLPLLVAAGLLLVGESRDTDVGGHASGGLTSAIESNASAQWNIFVTTIGRVNRASRTWRKKVTKSP